QALLLVQSGLELSEGDWTLYANDPDLDTVLALWCLLNHRRVRELSAEARDVLLPLFRLEGAIDANGPELAALCGLPADAMARTQQRIDDLLARERALKQTGSWAGKNVHAYTLEMLQAVDALVFKREDFGDHTRIEEIYGHVEVAPRRVAVACRDRSGIYTVEQHLKSRWGDQLAIIALENQPGVYTLRRISSLSGPELDVAYERLNRVDEAVDGRPPGKRWGGSRDIGGSPRPQGTRLSAEELLEELAKAYAPTSWWTRTRAGAAAFLVGLAFLAFQPVAAAVVERVPGLALPRALQPHYELAFASLLALAVGMLATRGASHRRPWVFGWRRPAAGAGVWPWLLALAGPLPLAAWAGLGLPGGLPDLAFAAAATLLAVLAGEVWFRGLVHGMLAVDFPVQQPGGPWFVSRAAWVSSLAWALALASGVAWMDLGGAWVAAAAFAVGLALAVVRERWLSLLPGVAVQAAGVLLATGLVLLLR
ncbi:MAG: CPBP family glutamic-type intramembrane protease, partial [Myxococcota bacterium]